MRRKKILTLIIFLVTFISLNNAQEQRVLDSLLNLLKLAKEDTSQAHILIDLAGFYMYTDPQKSFEYGSQALALSQKQNSKIYIIESYQTLSAYYINSGKPDSSRDYLLKAIPLIEEIGHKHYLSDAFRNLSINAFYLNDYKGAFSYAEKALQLATEVNDSARIARMLNIVGLNYRDITADYPMALSYLLRSLSINQEISTKHALGANLYDIAFIYSYVKNYDKALEYGKQAMQISKENNNVLLLAEALAFLGGIYFLKNDLDTAQIYYKEALEATENTNYIITKIIAHHGLAEIKLEEGDIDKALELLDRALQMSMTIGDQDMLASTFLRFNLAYGKAKKYAKANEYLFKAQAIGNQLNRIDLLKDTYSNLADNYQHLGDYKKAFEYQEAYYKLNDSIKGEQVLKKTAELEVRFETEKKEKEIALLNIDKEVSKVEIKKQKVLKNAFIGGLGLLSILTVVVFSNFRNRNKLRLQRIRNRIADDLHDDIGSTLNSISVYSEVAKQKSPTVVQELEQIGEASRKIIDAMSDIVWTINTKNDSFEQIILRLRSFTYNLLRAKGIEHTFHADENLDSMKLSMEKRRNFYLIFKETLNNLVKYSNASHVSISLTHEHHFIILTISDNGIGFDSKKTYTGNGLLSMKTRAVEMQAILKIESEVGSGANIELKWKP
jgi:two-component system sensor histidine kinase UhpB